MKLEVVELRAGREKNLDGYGRGYGHRCRRWIVMIGLVAPLWAAAFPGAAGATSTVSMYGSAIETICDGDCKNRLDLETRRKAAGFDRPFELGLKLLEDDFDLTIESAGNIFVYGSLNQVGSITLEAKDSVNLFGEAYIFEGRYAVPPLLINPPRIEPPSICLCIVGGAGISLTVPGQLDLGATLTAGARIDLRAGQAGLASVVGLDAPLAPSSGIAISRKGDIYLDLSMAGSGRLALTAGKSIFSVESDLLPVPEPGTGLLLGLGLISLAIRRARPSTSAAATAAL